MLTLDDRLEITARLAQLSAASREELALPAECPRHPGERQYDQDWLVYLTGGSGTPQVLAAAVLAQCPEIFYAHLQWSVFVLEARGFGSAGLTATLQRMLREVANTFTPAVRGWLREVLEHGLDVVRQMSATLPPRLLDPSAPRQEAFLLALLSGDRLEALRLVDEALAHGDRWMTICTQLIDHVMDEIGRLWALHQINVAQEHMATAVAQMAFSQLSFRIGPAPGFRARGPAVITGLHNERHQFGARPGGYAGIDRVEGPFPGQRGAAAGCHPAAGHAASPAALHLHDPAHQPVLSS